MPKSWKKFYEGVEKTYQELMKQEIDYLKKKEYYINKHNIYNASLKYAIAYILNNLESNQSISLNELIKKIPSAAKDIHDREFLKEGITSPEFSIDKEDCVKFIFENIEKMLVIGKYSEVSELYTCTISYKYLKLRNIISDSVRIKEYLEDYSGEELDKAINPESFLMKHVFPEIFEIFHTHPNLIEKDFISQGEIKFNFVAFRELLNIIMDLLQKDIKLNNSLAILEFLEEIEYQNQNDEEHWHILRDLYSKASSWAIKIKISLVLYSYRFAIFTKKQLHRKTIEDMHQAIINHKLEQEEKKYLHPILVNLYKHYLKKGRIIKSQVYYTKSIYKPTYKTLQFNFKDLFLILKSIETFDKLEYKEFLLETVKNYPIVDYDNEYSPENDDIGSQTRVFALDELYQSKVEDIFELLKISYLEDPSHKVKEKALKLLSKLGKIEITEYEDLISRIILMDEEDFYSNNLFEQFLEDLDNLDTDDKKRIFFNDLIQFLDGINEIERLQRIMHILDHKNDINSFHLLLIALEKRNKDEYSELIKTLQGYITISNPDIELDNQIVQEFYSVVFKKNQSEIKSMLLDYLRNNIDLTIKLLPKIKQSIIDHSGFSEIKHIQILEILFPVLKQSVDDEYNIIDFILEKKSILIQEKKTVQVISEVLSNLSKDVLLIKLRKLEESFKVAKHRKCDMIATLLKVKGSDDYTISTLVKLIPELAEYDLKLLLFGLEEKNKSLAKKILREEIKKNANKYNFNYNYSLIFLEGQNSITRGNLKKMERKGQLSDYEKMDISDIKWVKKEQKNLYYFDKMNRYN